jgi:hypothetical protein
MPRLKPISPEEHALITRSAMRAWIVVRADFTPHQELRRLIRKQRRLTHEQAREEEVLCELQYCDNPLLTSMRVRDVVLAALERNDRTFFRRLGRVLTHRPRKPRKRQGNRLAVFLASHWAKPHKDVPELFYLTPDALTKVCRQTLKMPGLTTDAVTKARRRLRLKVFRRQKRSAVFRGGRWTFPRVDTE